MITMKKFFKDRSEIMLSTLSVIFLAVIGGFLYWTVQIAVMQVGRTVGQPASQTIDEFDLKSAAKIDFKGLLQ